MIISISLVHLLGLVLMGLAVYWMSPETAKVTLAVIVVLWGLRVVGCGIL